MLYWRPGTIIVTKIVGTIGPSPSPWVQCWDIELSVRWGGGGGRGNISFSNMIRSVWEWSTEFVVRVLFVTVDYEEAFQSILTRIVPLCENDDFRQLDCRGFGKKNHWVDEEVFSTVSTRPVWQIVWYYLSYRRVLTFGNRSECVAMASWNFNASSGKLQSCSRRYCFTRKRPIHKCSTLSLEFSLRQEILGTSFQFTTWYQDGS